MPVSFQQIRSQIKEKGPAAVHRQKVLEERIEEAFALLNQYQNDLDFLHSLVDRAAAADTDLRCAVPGAQPLTLTIPAPAAGLPLVILAADGSQINPDRHNQVEFGVINTGAVRFAPGAVSY